MLKLVKLGYIRPDDFEQVLKIELKNHSYKEDDEIVIDPRYKSKKDLISFIGQRRSRVIVVRGVDVEGFMLFDARNEKISVVDRLCVDEWGNGYEKMLLDQAISWARKYYVDKVVVYCHEFENEKIKFLSESGFKAKLLRNHNTFNNKKFDELEFSKKMNYDTTN